MADTYLSRFLGRFVLRDGSDSTKLASVSAAGGLKTESGTVSGSATWTKYTLALDGTSQSLTNVGAGIKGLIIFNRVGNDQIDVDIAGGTVAANTGRTILGGNDFNFTGAYTPTSTVTIIGTNGQTITYWVAT